MTPAGATGPGGASSLPSVSVLLPRLDGGGAERSLLTVTEELHRRGRDVELIAIDARGHLASAVSDGLPLTDLARPHVRSSVPALASHLRARRPAVLIATLEHAVVTAAAAIALARTATTLIPRVANTMSAMGGSASGRDRVANAAAAVVYRHARVTIAVSHGVADDLVEHVRVDRRRVRVLANPVIETALVERVRRVRREARDPVPTVIGMGRLTAQKDFGLLLRAFAAVRRDRVARLVLLGEGEERPALERLAAELGIADDVSLPGFVPDPMPEVARATVFVLSSAWEGLPGALIQALACGIPLVATDCPSGPREVLADGVHGRLVPVGDVDRLTAAITDAIDGRVAPPVPDAWAPYELGRAVDGYEQVIAEAAATTPRVGHPVPVVEVGR